MPNVFSYPMQHRAQPIVDIDAKTQYFADYAAKVTMPSTTSATMQRQRDELQAIWESLPAIPPEA